MTKSPADQASHADRAASARITIRLGHSPDPDDAFMWWPLFDLGGEGPVLDTGRFRFEQVCQDIQTLNDRSLLGELEITAMSMHQYPHVADCYVLTRCGASMGERYGPKLVARASIPLDRLRDAQYSIATPGERTTAFLVLSLLLGPGKFRHAPMPFETIIEAVANGSHDAGLIIHEGQLTFAEAGLVELADMGAWWHDQHGLPLPLGGNAVKRELESLHGPGTLAEIARLLERSIAYALDHRNEGLDFAMRFARDMTMDQVDRFITMYVNDYTLDPGDRGCEAIRVLLESAAQTGLTPDPGEIQLLGTGTGH